MPFGEEEEDYEKEQEDDEKYGAAVFNPYGLSRSPTPYRGTSIIRNCLLIGP